MRDCLRCWAEIDGDALRHNADEARRRIGPEPLLMAVVKANGYGHGAVEVVRALRDRVQMFGVANLAEARQVRAVVPEVPVMILGAALAGERAAIVREGFLPVVSSVDEARAYAALGPVRGHVAIDTGMGRLGIWQEDAPAALAAIRALPNFHLAGISTHLPSADDDPAFTLEQLRRFEAVTAGAVVPGCVVHALNSAGILRFPEHAGGMVRAGLMLYGSAPMPAFQDRLRPAMTWKTRVTLVREVGAGRTISYGRTFTACRPMRVATLAVGYADGYPRALSGRGAVVLIRGQRCPVLGRITMDQTMVDVSDLPDAQAGDEAVLLGRQGGGEILAAELAAAAGTIAWEIFTGVQERVGRFYSA